MNPALARFFKSRSALVEKELKRLLRPKAAQPDILREAMVYSIFAGGKRLRPVLVMAAAECCGAAARSVLGVAAAFEMIHTYSLIHDDLPAMDDDDLRRGKPTNHKVFGEAVAILAGDGLLTYAFQVSAENAAKARLNAASSAELIRVIAKASGAQGMVGGQVSDLQAEGNWRKRNHGFDAEKTLKHIHLHKTAALIVGSLEAGAILAGASAAERRALVAYGRAIGLSFQIADDILDVVGDKKKLGKRGSDRDNDKLTFVSLYGLDEARAQARALTAKAHAALKPFAAKARPLHLLADYIIERDT